MSASVIALAAVPLARTSEGSKSGPIGLAIILLLCVACYFLFKSMSGHLRRVREDFPAVAKTTDVQPAPAQSTAAQSTNRAAAPPVITTVSATAEQPPVDRSERPDRPANG